VVGLGEALPHRSLHCGHFALQIMLRARLILQRLLHEGELVLELASIVKALLLEVEHAFLQCLRVTLSFEINRVDRA